MFGLLWGGLIGLLLSFQFVLLWSFSLFFKGKERVKNWVGGKNLKGAGKGKSVIRMYCMKKFFINKKETEGGGGKEGKWQGQREWCGGRESQARN